MIRLATLKDVDDILVLWKNTLKLDGRCLAIPFRSGIEDLVNKQQFYVYIENEKIIGFGGFKVMKRKNVIKIVNLCVDVQHRKKNIGIKIVKTLIEKASKFELKFVVECQEGAGNNTFWLKYGKQIGVKECKTMNVKIVLLDDVAIRRMYL